MGRPFDRDFDLAEETTTQELDLALLALVAASAAGTAVLSYLLWRRWAAGVNGRSRRLLHQLDAARSLLRRQLASGQDDRADETRIRIAELQRAIMQLEGYI
jgi:hypothetical protein